MAKKSPATPASDLPEAISGKDFRRLRSLSALLDTWADKQQFTLNQGLALVEEAVDAAVRSLEQARPQAHHAAGVAVAAVRDIQKRVLGRDLVRADERLRAWIVEATALEAEFHDLDPHTERARGLAQALTLLDSFRNLEAAFALAQAARVKTLFLQED